MLPTLGKQSKTLFDAIKRTMKLTDIEIAIIPCLKIPLTLKGEDIDDYRKWKTYYSIERKIIGVEVYNKYVKDPILLCREGWEKKFPEALHQLRPYSEKEIQEVSINYSELKEAISYFNEFNVLLAEPGSESDFLAMTGRIDLLLEFVDLLKDYCKCPIVIGTHHAGLTIPILEENEMTIDGYVTPINKLGAMMFPTQSLAFEAIKKSKKKIIAIKPLAGGRISPYEAFKYVYRKVNADACMVGVAFIKEVDEDLSMVRRVIINGD